MEINIWQRWAKTVPYVRQLNFVFIASLLLQWAWFMYAMLFVMGRMILAGATPFAVHYLTVSAVTVCYAILLLNFHRVSSLEQKKNSDFAAYEHYVADLFDNTRLFRHEFRNRLFVLEGYYQSQNREAFQGALQHWNDEAQKLNALNIDALYRIHDLAVREVLILCLADAEKKGLLFEIRFSCEDSTFELLSKHLGFLNNAVHSAFALAEGSESKTTSLYVTDDKGEPSILLATSVDKSAFSTISAHKLFANAPFPVEITVEGENDDAPTVAIMWTLPQ